MTLHDYETLPEVELPFTTATEKWSLRFRADASEEAFAEASLQQLLKSWEFVSKVLLVFNVMILALLIYYYTQLSSEAQPDNVRHAVLLQIGAMIFWVVYALLCLIALTTPSFVGHIKAVHAEMALTAICILAMCTVCLMKEYSLGKMFDLLPYYAKLLGSDCFSDSWIFLMLLLIQTIGHQSLPIRWCVLWPVTATGAVIYVVLVWRLGSPEQYPAVLWFTYVVILIFFTHGKRSRELTSRSMFLLVAEERVKRTEAEFMLERTLESAKPKTTQCQTSNESTPGATPESALGSSMLSSIMFTDHYGIPFEKRVIGMMKFAAENEWFLPWEHIEVKWESCLGHGGYGSIFEGSFLHSPVAVKTPQMSDLRARGERDFNALTNEIRMLRKMRHPNIVCFYGITFDASFSPEVLLVEELVKGRSLLESVKKRSIPSDKHSIRIIKGVCSALAYLHDASVMTRFVVHGDLKPSNVMLDRSLKAKLVDFGLSRLHNHQRGGGTRGYVAPEVILGSKPACSADVYSLGGLAFFTVTAEQPPTFSDRDARQLFEVELGTISVPLEWPQQLTALQSCCKELCVSCMLVKQETRKTSKELLEIIHAWA